MNVNVLVNINEVTCYEVMNINVVMNINDMNTNEVTCILMKSYLFIIAPLIFMKTFIFISYPEINISNNIAA